MKSLLKIALLATLALGLSGTLGATDVQFDGGNPLPTCDPGTCKPPGM